MTWQEIEKEIDALPWDDRERLMDALGLPIDCDRPHCEDHE